MVHLSGPNNIPNSGEPPFITGSLPSPDYGDDGYSYPIPVKKL